MSVMDHGGRMGGGRGGNRSARSEEHTSELQSRQYLVCRLLLEKKIEQRLLAPATAGCSHTAQPIPVKRRQPALHSSHSQPSSPASHLPTSHHASTALEHERLLACVLRGPRVRLTDCLVSKRRGGARVMRGRV